MRRVIKGTWLSDFCCLLFVVSKDIEIIVIIMIIIIITFVMKTDMIHSFVIFMSMLDV